MTEKIILEPAKRLLTINDEVYAWAEGIVEGTSGVISADMVREAKDDFARAHFQRETGIKGAYSLHRTEGGILFKADEVELMVNYADLGIPEMTKFLRIQLHTSRGLRYNAHRALFGSLSEDAHEGVVTRLYEPARLRIAGGPEGVELYVGDSISIETRL
ncbi:hypothetical protein ACFL0V_02610 [Nanoarchaeota archaeon]